MTHELIHRLTELIPPPCSPDPFSGNTVNPVLGRCENLPGDYLEFMAVYGPGWFTENGHPSIQIFDVAGERDLLDVKEMLRCAEEVHSIDPITFPSPYPASPGLLPWGMWDQGFTLNWWVHGAPNTWRVAIDARTQIEWHTCSFAEYLLGNIGRQPGYHFRTHLLPEAVEIRYCPTNYYQECFRGEYKL